MNTMDCTDIKALLSAYLDDELDADQRHAAERHIAECADCQSLVSEAESLDALLARGGLADGEEAVAAMSLPDDFEAKVLLRTAYADQVSRGRAGGWWLWSGWMVAAASVAVVVVAWTLGSGLNLRLSSSMLTMGLAEDDSGDREAAGWNEDDRLASRAFNASMTYSTGLDLQSRTSEVALPAEFFLASRTEIIEDPEFGPEQPIASGASAETAQNTILGRPKRMPDPLLVGSADPAPILAGGIDRERLEAIMNRPALAAEDAQTLYAVSIALDLLRSADLSSFADVELIRRVIEYDELLPRLAAVRDRVGAVDRPVVMAAESILLRIERGPLNRSDVRLLRDTVAQLDLSDELDAMSSQARRRGSL